MVTVGKQGENVLSGVRRDLPSRRCWRVATRHFRSGLEPPRSLPPSMGENLRMAPQVSGTGSHLISSKLSTAM